ncbi:MAG: hypothetical protein ABIJ56_22650 [Pseudomonadota bacterium]
MAALDDYISAIKALHERGLNRSALSIFRKADETFGDSVRGPTINRLIAAVRQAAKYPKIPPGIYALTSFEGVGIVVPIQAEEGSARIGDPAASQAWHTAHEYILANRKELLSQRPSSLSIPVLKPVLPQPFELEGGSLGLPAALAIISRLGASPRKPVLATGQITDKGMIDSIGQLEEKLEAAISELGDTDGVILVPAHQEYTGPRAVNIKPVRNLAEAISAVLAPKVKEPKESFQSEPSPSEKRKSLPSLLFVFLMFLCVGFLGGVTILYINACEEKERIQPQPEPLQFETNIPPTVEPASHKADIKEVIDAYRGLQIAWETCKRDAYYGYFVEELDRYYNLDPAPLDFIKSARDARFDENCQHLKGHRNAAIQFIEISQSRAVITICPSGSWKDGTCVDRKTGGPWELAKIFGYVKEGGEWKILFEFSNRDNLKKPHRHDVYRGYKIDPKAWIEIW